MSVHGPMTDFLFDSSLQEKLPLLTLLNLRYGYEIIGKHIEVINALQVNSIRSLPWVPCPD